MDAACRNCATPLAGRWCHACGQDSRDPLRDFPLLAAEYLDGVFGWDSRLLRTVRLLFGAPGALTDEFVAGRRAAYLGPVRLYILVSVVYAATYAAFGGEVSLLYLVGGGDFVAGQRELAHIQGWLSLALVLLMPFAAVLMALVFRAPGIGIIEHLVFVLHINCFVLLLWALGCPLGWLAYRLGGPLPEIASSMVVNSVIFYYGYRAARRRYRRGEIDSFLRLCAYGLLSTGMLRGIAIIAQRVAAL